MFMRVKLIPITAAVALIFGVGLLHARAGGGTVSGKVTYEGTPAKAKPIDMSKDPSCAKQHTTPITTETSLTAPTNTLQNTMMYLSPLTPHHPPPPHPVKL